MLGYQSRVHPLSMTHDQLFSGERGSRIPYHRMYGKEYCLPSLIVFSEEEAEKLREASEQVDRIYKKVLGFVQRELPDLLLIKLLGLDPELISAARIEVPFHGISRQDWIVTGEGIKCIENNTDTPTGIPETAYLSDSILHNSSSYENPSKGMDDAIQLALIRLIEHYQGQGLTGDIVFSSYGEHIEDYTNTHYLLDRVRETGLNARFAPLDEIELVAGEGIYHQGSKIDIWYRLYPLEYLVHDHDDEGRPIGREVLHLIEKGKLGLINPVQSIITQSKGFMALIWSLYENNQELFLDEERSFFSEEEMSGIRTYLLPTYVSSEPFKQSHRSYVSKGYWGREGKGTTLYNQGGQPELDEWGDVKESEEEAGIKAYYSEQPQIYQERVAMEAVSVSTEEGIFQGYLLSGVYVIGNQYAGILPRIGGPITGDMAYYCPAAVRRSKE